jgi:hypothetical protein
MLAFKTSIHSRRRSPSSLLFAGCPDNGRRVTVAILYVGLACAKMYPLSAHRARTEGRALECTRNYKAGAHSRREHKIFLFSQLLV